MGARHPLLVFADGDLAWSLPLRKRLTQRGLAVETASSAQTLLSRLERTKPDLIVLADRLDDLGGQFLTCLVRERSPATRIIRVLTDGSSSFSDKPGPTDGVLCSVSRRSSVDDLARLVSRVLGFAPQPTPPKQPPLVVCVDDDPAFLRSLGRLIRRQGYRVLLYPEPERALEELPLVNPDLVILDVLMPGLSGFEVLGEIRQFHPASLAVVLLSALDDDERFAQGGRHGAAGYLTKPCPPELLLETVRRVLARAGTREDAPAPDRSGPAR